MELLNKKTERLYMLEFLVDRLNLRAETIAEIGSSPITVTLAFLDFPTFVIRESEFWSSKQRNEKRAVSSGGTQKDGGDVTLDLSAGKSCLFLRRPEALIEAIRSRPLLISVHKKIPVKQICSREEVAPPVCKAEVPLAGCLCDQVAMSRNEPSLLPEPYTLRNTWNLIDESGRGSGTIELFLRLTCLGESLTTRFAFNESTLLFKNAFSGDEFRCDSLPGDEPNGTPEKHRRATSPRRVLGLASICRELAQRDGGPPEQVETRSKRSSCRDAHERSPEVAARCCNEHVHVSRTARTFRRPEYACRSEYYSGASCVAQTRVGTCSSAVTYAYRPRMRGGGPWDENDRVCEDVRMFSKYRQRSNVQSLENLMSGACKSFGDSSRLQGCGCFGKIGTGATLATNLTSLDSGCEHAPCQGIDCLIRAFKETEDFVESIGRVPGCAGLGLPDPEESPYFRRERDAPTSCHSRMPWTTVSRTGQAAGRGDFDRDPLRSAVTTPMARPRRKTDEKSQENAGNRETEETGPCGEIICKSKKLKPDETPEEVDEPIEVKPEEPRKSSAREKSLTPRKSRRSKSKSPSTPRNVSRPSVRRSSQIRVSKAVLRLVDAYRDSRFCYGHRECLDARPRVPGDMGWLWSSVGSAPARLRTPIGWKPGAVSKFVWKRLQRAKKAMIAATASSASNLVRVGSTTRAKRPRAPRNRNFNTLARDEWASGRMRELDKDEIELPPTLHVHRKDGTYYVTMYPVRNPPDPSGTGDNNEENSKPLQFKITKNREEGVVDSSSTGSDMEIEFSPPAAITRYRKKEPVADRDTQVCHQEILDAVKVPHEIQRISKPKKVRHKK